MNNVCDLQRDFETRESQPSIGTESGITDATDEGVDGTTDQDMDSEEHHLLVPHVILCDLIPPEKLKQRMDYNEKALKKALERTRNRSEPRFHCLESAEIEGGGSLGEFVIDFKKTFALPTASIYEGIRADQIKRTAVVPAIFVHDLTHRFHSYLSRVGIP